MDAYRVALTPGCQIGYMGHTGCHQLVFLPIRSTRVVTPGGCQAGYMDHTGSHQVISWCFDCKVPAKCHQPCQCVRAVSLLLHPDERRLHQHALAFCEVTRRDEALAVRDAALHDHVASA
jgi:hypothetical protein